MKPFVGVKKALSVTQLLDLIQVDLIQKLATESSYYFLRWTHKVSGIIQDSPTEAEWKQMIEGQMFNSQFELRWKQKRKDSYEVLLLSVAGEYSDFISVGKDWQTQDRDAHLHSPTETRFPKGFPEHKPEHKLDIAQRYFIDKETATVHFVALTVKHN